MHLNRIEDCDVQTLVHQTIARSNAPERRRANLVCGTLAGVLNNAVAGTDVVQSKIAEGMNNLVA